METVETRVEAAVATLTAPTAEDLATPPGSPPIDWHGTLVDRRWWRDPSRRRAVVLAVAVLAVLVVLAVVRPVLVLVAGPVLVVLVALVDTRTGERDR